MPIPLQGMRTNLEDVEILCFQAATFDVSEVLEVCNLMWQPMSLKGNFVLLSANIATECLPISRY